MIKVEGKIAQSVEIKVLADGQDDATRLQCDLNIMIEGRAKLTLGIEE